MPKIKRMQKPKYFGGLIREYMRMQKITSEQLATKVGNRSASTVRAMYARPATKWKVSDISRYCKALNIPLEESAENIIKEIR